MEKIDNLDRHILKIVMHNARIPSKDVAMECGVSRAAIHQRLQRMIDLKVITGSGYHVNPKILGYATCTYVGVNLERGAMYRDAAFLILDEPTAALDPMAEYELYTRLNEIVEDRTAVYISHRLSSCRFCDEILVFHKGCLVQQGSHERLLAQKDGKYRELWNAQAQYYVSTPEVANKA